MAAPWLDGHLLAQLSMALSQWSLQQGHLPFLPDCSIGHGFAKVCLAASAFAVMAPKLSPKITRKAVTAREIAIPQFCLRKRWGSTLRHTAGGLKVCNQVILARLAAFQRQTWLEACPRVGVPSRSLAL